MSDRLNLWRGTKAPWAEVDINDHPSMESAIEEFSKSWQTLKVFGPVEAIAQAKQIWQELYEKESIKPVDEVHFVVQGYPGDCSALRRPGIWD